MGKLINWKTVAGACIAAGAFAVRWLVTHSIPEELKSADSFTAINLKWAGIANPPAALVSQAADHWILVGATVLITAGLVLFAWGVVSWVRSRKAQKSALYSEEQIRELARSSPIQIADDLYVDLDHVKNEKGDKVDGCYSVAVCLWVTNGLETGVVLRNLQARYYHLSGEYTLLPIRGSERGVVDLRHGEVAVVEIGRMLWRLTGGDNTLPGAPRGGLHYQTVDQMEIDHNSAPVSHFRSFKISNALGKSQGGIGQMDDDHRFGAMQIVISADDVVSRYVRMQTDLYQKDSSKWLKFLPKDWRDDQQPE